LFEGKTLRQSGGGEVWYSFPPPAYKIGFSWHRENKAVLMRFCVLGSGSAGNASLLTHAGFGILLDLGVGPRTLAQRLAEVGAAWDDVSAALLTHVHGDHWNENTLAHLRRRNIPLFCHQSHATTLKHASSAFAALLDNDCLCFYDVDRDMTLTEGITCRPLALRHDAGITCGFRFEGKPDWLGQTWALGYVADLGSWNYVLAEALANVDILALEFNHDEWMQRSSGRTASLIQRVLGDHGHLSNRQAAALLTEVLRRSASGRLRHIVQLHLSRQCNSRGLARLAARGILEQHSPIIQLHTADQNCPVDWLTLRPGTPRRKARPKKQTVWAAQPWLPGWET
jgi:phosphoribosyl 1,2-cyclic phosphodiesterase